MGAGQTAGTDSSLAADSPFLSELRLMAEPRLYKLDCKLTCGSFQRGNSISMRRACFPQIKHRSRYHVFWAGCYQRIDGADNKIRRTKIAGRWANRGEASLCDTLSGPAARRSLSPAGVQSQTQTLYSWPPLHHLHRAL